MIVCSAGFYKWLISGEKYQITAFQGGELSILCLLGKLAQGSKHYETALTSSLLIYPLPSLFHDQTITDTTTIKQRACMSLCTRFCPSVRLSCTENICLVCLSGVPGPRVFRMPVPCMPMHRTVF